MKLLSLLFVISPVVASYAADRTCGQNRTNLWLDVVIVVDNSSPMTVDNLELITSNIDEVFGRGVRIGDNYTDPRSTRVALVTYNKNVANVLDLNQFKSYHDLYQGVGMMLGSTVDTQESYLSVGLAKAEEVLASGRSNNYRSNYKQLILVYAATYQGTGDLDPMPVANRLKKNDVYITVVSFGDDTTTSFLAHVSSDRDCHQFDDTTGYDVTQSLMKTNCYCRDPWTLYESLTYKYGLCLQVSAVQTNWMSAKFACQNMDRNGYLATEFGSGKHMFIQQMFEVAEFEPHVTVNSSYHIGLTFVSGQWFWQQPNGQPLVKLLDKWGSGFQLWNKNYPTTATTNTGVANIEIEGSSQTGWQNLNPYLDKLYYICEAYTCDTDYYCE